MPKRILIFSLVYYPKHGDGGGAEVALKEITDRISKDDIEFHMVTLGYDSTLPEVSWEGNVLVHRIGLTRPNIEVEQFGIWPLKLNKYIFQFLAAWKAHKLNKKYKYDATWAMMAHACGVPAALFKIFHPRVPYILTLQEGDPIEKIEKSVRPLWPLFTRAFTLADVVQPISKYLADWALARNVSAPIETIPNGASLPSAADYPQAELNELRQSLNVAPEDKLLLSVARLEHQKALDIVIRALTLLPSNIKYVMVGDGDNREMLENLAKELGVSDRIRFTGRVDRTMTAKYRKISDIFVLPSRSEGQGISFLSTMASGLPMVATQVGGIAEFLFDESRNPELPTTGWAVDKDSPEQIATAVEDVLANPDRALEVAENAKKLAREKYSWEAIVKQMRERVFDRAFSVNIKN